MREDGTQLNLSPRLEEWRKCVLELFELLLRELCRARCMATTDLGASRENLLLKVFSGEDDALIVENRAARDALEGIAFQIS